MMRANSVGEPRKVELYAEKSKPVAGGPVQKRRDAPANRYSFTLHTRENVLSVCARALVHGYTLMRADAITLAMRL